MTMALVVVANSKALEAQASDSFDLIFIVLESRCLADESDKSGVIVSIPPSGSSAFLDFFRFFLGGAFHRTEIGRRDVWGFC
jgi:hypothetical protein